MCICMFNPLLSGKLKSDLVKEVAYTRRKQHQASLQYYCALNALQYRKRIAMLEPMLGYTQAQVLSSCGPTTVHYLNSVFKRIGDIFLVYRRRCLCGICPCNIYYKLLYHLFYVNIDFGTFF